MRRSSVRELTTTLAIALIATSCDFEKQVAIADMADADMTNAGCSNFAPPTVVSTL